MSHKKRVTSVIIKFITLIILAISANNGASAASFATLVYTAGEVRLKARKADDWSTNYQEPIVHTGDWVRTMARSAALLLKPDGSFTILAENQTIQINLYSEKNQGINGNLVSALSYFFSRHPPKYFSESRGDSAFQKDWVRLMEQNKFSISDLEKSFELINAYTELGYWNRVSALLQKLKSVYPENPGFYQLCQQAMSGLQPGIHWQVTRITDGTKYTLEPGSELYKGDSLFLQLYRNEESFYYLFLTARKDSDSWRTTMLFPDSIYEKKQSHNKTYFASRLGPKETLYYPINTADTAFSFRSGNKHFWGWSCDGPLLDDSVIEKVTYKVEDHIAKHGKITRFVVAMLAPELCRSAFSFSFKLTNNKRMALSEDTGNE